MLKCEHPDCEGSEREFASERDLKIHFTLNHTGKVVQRFVVNAKCQMPGCGRTFETERALKVHFRKTHPEITKEWYAEHFRTNEWATCPICGKEYYRTLKAQRIGKNPTCGNRECYLKFIDAKKKATCLEKYGVDHQMKIPEVSAKCHTKESEERRKETYLERYGYDNPFKNPEWHHDWDEHSRKCARESYKEKTGYSSPLANPEVRTAFEDKREEKTGYRNPLSNPIIREQINETIDKQSGGRMAIIEKGQVTYKNKTGYKCAFANPEVHKMIDDEREAKTGYRNAMQNPAIKEKTFSNENYINRKSKYKKGWYKSTKTRVWEHFDSSYEYIRFLQLDEDSNVFYWHKNRSQTIEYQKYNVETDSFSSSNCIPDLFVVYNDLHIEVEELKGAEISINTWLKLDAISKFCANNDMTFKYLMHEHIMYNEYWKSKHDDFVTSYKREDWKQNDR